MNYVINKAYLFFDNKIIQITIFCWFFIEVLQNTKYANNYFVMHFSSYFGAIVLLYLLDFFKLSKWLNILPILIEIPHSLFFQGSIDIEDILFSLIGIISYLIIFKKNYNICK
jgi:hypothetical protein